MSSSSVEAITAWTLHRQIDVPQEVFGLLTQGEQPVVSFATFRDSATFTTKRLIIRDAQGMTGKKVEMYSIPYKSIDMWSSENAGTFDLNSEIELWTRAGNFKLNLKSDIDIRALDNLIGDFVLSS